MRQCEGSLSDHVPETAMRSLIVVTILCLASTPAFACVFHTDCNPGATCEDGVCSDARALQNDNDRPSSNANDNALTSQPQSRTKGKSCYDDSDCSQGRCVKGSGIKGVCIGQ
jgi:hypothetical protein